MKGFTKIDKALTDLNLLGPHQCIGILYDTTVYYQTGSKFRLNSGGWKTMSTKKAINKCLPNGYYLRQKDFQWFLKTPNGVLLEYSDNMEINMEDYQ